MNRPSSPRSASVSLAEGRLVIALAAVLWSLSGAFTKLLTKETVFGLASPPLAATWIAFFRTFFAGLAMLPLLQRREVQFRWPMLAMMLCFGIMNLLYVVAMAQGTAANAVLLQYTAPMWMYLASIWWLGEKPDPRNTVVLFIGLAGIGIIISGGWQEAQLGVVAIALGSGVAYAAVLLWLRVLREASSRWLTTLNQLFAALLVVPVLCWQAPAGPTTGQILFLAIFGSVQMALPYWLVARGLRVVSPQEAGTITLLEPLLNPLWAYLVSPESEVPSGFTFAGGAFILGALAWRYWPRRPAVVAEQPALDSRADLQ